jgi:cytochrome P450
MHTPPPTNDATSNACPAQGMTSPTGCPVSSLAAKFDPFQGAYQTDPAASLREARREEPVFYSPLLDYWVVTRYEDVKHIFKNPDTFSAAITLEQIAPISAEAIDILAGYAFAPGPVIVNEDEPDHDTHRRALMEPFETDAVEQLVPRIREVIESYVDRFVTRGHADLVNDLTYEVPAIVAFMFLGVPDEDIDTVRQFGMQQTLFTWGRPDITEQERVATGLGQFWEFAGDLVKRLKTMPDAPGWIPHAIRVQKDNPELVNDNYLQNMAMSGTLAAHETTSYATANAFRTLLENRSSWEQLCSDPRLIPRAVEECLRYSGSVVAWRRKAVADTTVREVDIPEGSRLLLVTASANRDDDVFTDPDTFDINRVNTRRHLTFGVGTHTCMGATLARVEMGVFLEVLSSRLPHMHLVEGQSYTYLPNTSFRGPEHVLVTWDPTLNPRLADRL